MTLNSGLKYILPIILFALVSFTEPPATGIFIVKKPGKKNPCEQDLKMLIGSKRVCVLKKPIVSVDELEYVTDLLYDPIVQCNYIKLGFSSGSVLTLNQTVTTLPAVEFAVVVDDNVICIFKIQEKLQDRFIKIGYDLDNKSLTMVRDALKKVEF
jgi:hypothetical protein